MARGKRWFHGKVSTFLLLAVLFLSVFGVWLSLYLDRTYINWIQAHPITSNLIASGLAIPAAFLIVNLAAERAVHWAEKARWTEILESDMEAVIQAWSELRPTFLTRYGIADPGTAFTSDRTFRPMLPSPPNINSSSMLDKLTVDDLSTARSDSAAFKTAASVVAYDRSFLRHHPREAEQRDHLRSVLLPRIERRVEDPEIVRLVRAAENSLNKLAASWIDYDAGYVNAGFQWLSTAISSTEFPNNMSDGDANLCLVAVEIQRRLFAAADSLLESMDGLADRLEQEISN